MVLFLVLSCGSDDGGTGQTQEMITVSYARLGSNSIVNQTQVPIDSKFYIGFSAPVELNASNFSLTHNSSNVSFSIDYGQTNREIVLDVGNSLVEGDSYTLTISSNLKGVSGEKFDGKTYNLNISVNPLILTSIKESGQELNRNSTNKEFPLSPTIILEFTQNISPSQVASNLSFSPAASPTIQAINAHSVSISFTQPLNYWTKYEMKLGTGLGQVVNRPFSPVDITLFTTVDPTNKFPYISDEQLLDLVQKQSFKYFWDFGHPNSGMARERNTSTNTVTTGGTGFGLQAMVVAVSRNWITRQDAINRWDQIISFLETADRFHGAWPHWINGNTGHVINFSTYDNGADLVETAFLIQGLLTVRAYLDSSIPAEQALQQRITDLWEDVEWTWFQKNGEKVLYWHWSPNYGWQMNLKIRGHNETQIVYVLAASSPTYPITKAVYDEGYARGGNIVNGKSFFGIELPLGNQDYGGPLFFTHYSYLGLDPRNLVDDYANYWTQNQNHSLINYNYCANNPSQFIGYSGQFWGLTASDDQDGYSAHSPTNDSGVITPTAALSSMPYTPTKSMDALKFFYYTIGDRLWGEYGFYDAINPTEEWVATSYLAIDQGPIICMIENYRTQLLWDTFMQDSDIISGLNTLNFSF